MNFDPYNRPLKIWKSIGAPTPKVGIHLGCGVSFPHTFLTLSYIHGNMKCDTRASLLAYTFISPYLGNEPKVKVVTLQVFW
jgi:hypothetical protein